MPAAIINGRSLEHILIPIFCKTTRGNNMKSNLSTCCFILTTALLCLNLPTVYAAKTNKDSIKPFREIGKSLGLRGKNFDLFPEGVTVFDANNDGLLDIYLPHNGRPFPKATEKSVLTYKPVPSLPNTLYLNQGNDSNGDPVFLPMQELASKNKKYVKEELLIENKYIPRKSLKDDEFSIGRVSRSAIAADFNGDGRIDLYVMSSHYGIPYQSEETALRIYPVESNLGREDRKSREPLLFMTPPFLHTEGIKDGLKAKVNFSGKEEWEGSNRLFLNDGDKDGDGLPEWVDVTEQTGTGGKWDSASATVADIDRDGDLDIYIANFLDMDFFGFGMKTFAGNRNQLYINQLVETGKFTFVDKALDMSVSGLHKEENLPNGSYNLVSKTVTSVNKQIVNNQQIGEEADHSWSAQLTDWNDDGWPDLIVANDIGGTRLRVYENINGKSFKRLTQFDKPEWEGCWMGIESADLDGDGLSEILATNCGSQAVSIRNTAPFVVTEKEAEVQALSQVNYLNGKSTLHNTLLSYNKKTGLKDVTLDTKIEHSKIIPPDMTNKSNIIPKHADFYDRMKLKDSLTGLEFSWGPAMLDVENDGDLDIYLAGALLRGNDGLIGDFSGGPGRLLINNSSPQKFNFTDKVFEYRLLDIDHVDYDHSPARRPSPGTGWHKRDYIYMNDLDSYSEVGLKASQSGEIRDIIRMHEAAQSMIAGDLNNDGFADLVVSHNGGYNSLSPEARNLKININGKVRALPGTDKLRHPPTGHEPGRAFIYINGGVTEADKANWVRVRLLDKSSKNIYGIGAKLVINNKKVRNNNVGGPAFGGYTGDLLVGLGSEKLKNIQVRWPSGKSRLYKYKVDKPIANQLICIDRSKGIIPCKDNNKAQAKQ